jgi:predicted amidohydrolase
MVQMKCIVNSYYTKRSFHWELQAETLSRLLIPIVENRIMICYDVEFPELSRLMADQGMNILFVPF